MDDDLQPFFESRETRLNRLPEKPRSVFQQAMQGVDDPESIADRLFVEAWLARRVGVPRRQVADNFDAYAWQYFGKGATASAAYDQISAYYQSLNRLAVPQQDINTVGQSLRSLPTGAARAGYGSIQGATGAAAQANAALNYGLVTGAIDLRLEELRAREKALIEAITASPPERDPFAGPQQQALADRVRPGGNLDENQFELQQVQAEIASVEGLAKGIRQERDTSARESVLGQASQWAGEVRERAQADFGVDPEFAQTFTGQLFDAIGGLGFYIPTAMAGPVGVAAIGSASYQEAVDDYMETMKKQGREPDMNEAFRIGMTYAIPAALLERVGIDSILGEIFEEGTAITMRQLVGRMGKRGVTGALGEGTTEALQGLLLDALADATFDERDLISEEALKQRLNEFLIGTIVGFGAGNISAAVEGRDDPSAAPRERPQVEPPSILADAELILPQDGLPPSRRDFALLRDKYTDEEIQERFADAAQAEIVIAALNGDEQAQSVYQQAALQQIEAGGRGQRTAAPVIPLLEQGIIEATALTVEEEAAIQAELQAALAGETTVDAQQRSTSAIWTPADQRLAVDDAVRSLGLGGTLTKDERTALQAEARTQREMIKNERLRAKIAEVRKTATIRARERLEQQKATLAAAYAQRIEKLKTARINTAQAIHRLEKLYRSMPLAIRGKLTGFAEMATKGAVGQESLFIAKANQAIQELKAYERRLVRDRVMKRVNRLRAQIEEAKRSRKKLPYDGDAMTAYLDDIDTANQRDADAFIAQLAQVQKKLTEHEESELDTADWEILERAARPQVNSSTITAQELMQVEDDLKRIEAGLRTKAAEERERRQAQAQANAVTVSIEIEQENDRRGREHDTGIVDEKIKSEWWKRGKQHIFDHIRPERLVSLLTGKKDGGKFQRIFIDPIMKAEYAKTKALIDFRDRLKGWLTQWDIDASAMHQHVILAADAEINGGPNPLRKNITANEAMFIYAHAQNARGRAHLNSTKINGTRLSDEIIDLVVAALPDKYKGFVDSIIDWHDTVQYERLNEKYRRNYNISLPKEDRYMPIRNLERGGAASNIFADFSNILIFQKGNLKARTDSTLPFKRLDFLGDVAKNAANVEHLIAFEDTVVELNTLIQNEHVNKAIRRRDEEAERTLREYLKRVANGRLDRAGTGWTAIADMLRHNASIALIGLNIGSVLKVPASFFVGAREISAAETMNMVTRFWTDPKGYTDRMREKSQDTLAAFREDTFQRELAEMLQSEQAKKLVGVKGFRQKFIDFAFFLHRHVDVPMVAILWNAKYDEGINMGLSESEAVRAADKVVRDTQQTGRLVDLPKLYVAGDLSRMITQFTVDINAALNLGLRLVKTDELSAKAGLTYAGMVMLIPAIWLALTDLANDELKIALGIKAERDDEERREQFLQDVGRYGVSQTFGGIMPLNMVIEAQVAGLLGDEKSAYYLSRMSSPYMAGPIALASGDWAFATGTLMGIPGTPYWSKLIEEVTEDDKKKKKSMD